MKYDIIFAQIYDKKAEEVWKILLHLDKISKKSQSFTFIFSSHDVMPMILNYARESEDLTFTYARPIVWDKEEGKKDYFILNSHEYICILAKGRLVRTSKGIKDVIYTPYKEGKLKEVFNKLFIHFAKNEMKVLDFQIKSSELEMACKLFNLQYFYS